MPAKNCKKLTAAVLYGPAHRFGQVTFSAIISSEDAVVTHVLIPTKHRMEKFERSLLGPEYGLESARRIRRMLQAVPLLEHRETFSCLRRMLKTSRRSVEQHGLDLIPSHVIVLAVDDLRDANERKVIEEARVDVVVNADFPQVYPREWCQLGQRCTLNVHPSPLPRQAGSLPYWWSIFENDSERGVTIHRLDPQLDGGPILLQRRDRMPEESDYDDLRDWTYAMTPNLVHDALNLVRHHQETWRPQGKPRHVRRFPRIVHRRIWWQVDDSLSVLRKVRAGSRQDGVQAVCFHGQLRMEIGSGSIMPREYYCTSGLTPLPGTVMSWNRQSVDIATLDGVVRLTEISVGGWSVRCDRIFVSQGQVLI